MNTNKPNLNISRRSLIKGLAGTGLISSLHAEKVFAQTKAPLRVLFVSLHHGWGTGDLAIENITGSEFDFQLPAMWEPFNAIKDQCVFVDGLRGTWWGNAHDVSYSDILTAAVPIDADTTDRSLGGPFPKPVGPSVDYLLEQHHNMPALRFSAEYRTFGSSFHPLSFNDRIQNLPYYTSSKSAYDNLFASSSTGTASSAKSAITELFPYLSAETNRIIENIPESEKDKLINFLDASVALDTKLSNSTSTVLNPATVSSEPTANQPVNDEIDDYFDMIRVGFTNDTHRVAVMGIGEQSNAFEWTDTSGKKHVGHTDYTGDFHHEVAHYNEELPDSFPAYIAWTKYNAQKVVNFVESLENTIDIDGNPLIDNTMIVLTGEVGNGGHDRRSKPHIIIGGGDRVKRGRWYKTPRIMATEIGGYYPDGSYSSIADSVPWPEPIPFSEFSHADLLTKVANLAGLNISSIGFDVMNTSPLDI